jgi:hypothetical protein
VPCCPISIYSPDLSVPGIGKTANCRKQILEQSQKSSTQKLLKWKGPFSIDSSQLQGRESRNLTKSVLGMPSRRSKRLLLNHGADLAPRKLVQFSGARSLPKVHRTWSALHAFVNSLHAFSNIDQHSIVPRFQHGKRPQAWVFDLENHVNGNDINDCESRDVYPGALLAARHSIASQ